MINLYKKDETTFEHNGLGSLDKNILNPEISWKDNGAFTLEFKYPLFAKHGFEIENSSIIRANDPEGSNLFFVYKITPSMGYVTVLCYQISYKLAFNSINDTNIVNKSGQNALAQMSNATQYPHSFTFSSDIQTTATSRVVRKNPIEFLLDTGLDNSFVNRWGGHIVRHNFNIAMNTAYGSNKGYTIRHKKDLKGYEAEFDESKVITRIRPVGYDGLMLPETYIDSPLINNYVEPRIQEVEYSNVKVKTKDSDEEGFSTKELAYAELRRLANLEFSENKVDLPTFTCKVEFVNLKDTAEYKDLKSLKQILAGDIVKVVHSEDNFSIEAQMVEYKYNPLNNSYISITLGNYTKSFTSTVGKSLQTNLNQVAQQAQSAMNTANGKNTVYSLTYKPSITNSSVEGDLLYLKNGDKIELWILEKVNGKLQWVLQVSDATQEELKAQMAQAKTDINSAVDSANAAVDSANSAVDKANASVTAVQANAQLITDVNTVANNAKTQAQTAITNANTAKTNAQTALDKANGVSSKVTTIETNIDTINGTLSSKANTTDLNTLKGRVSTAESSITQNAGQIKLKANQADVNKITDKVNAVESSVTIQSGQISALNTKTDGQTTQIGKLESSYDGLTSTVSSVQNDLNNLTVGGENLLIDTDIGDLTKVNAPGNRYFSDASNTIVTAIGFKQVSDSPTPSGYVVEATSIGGGSSGGRRIAFYSGDGCPPFVKGETYTMSCYARKISGNPKIPFQYGNGTDGYNNKSAVDVDSTNWKQYSLTFVYTFDNPSIAYLGGISGLTAGTLQSCGFKVERGNKATSWGLSQYELATVTELSQLSQDLSGFKTTVASTYADKVSVASQITQSATAVTSDVQSWTNNKLTAYSTTQQTATSITNAVANKADKSQVTQLSNQITSTVSNFKNNILDNSDFRNGFTGWGSATNTFSSLVGVSIIPGLPMKVPTKYISFNYADLGGTVKWLVQTVNNPSLYAGSKLRMSVYYYGNNAPGDKSFEFYSRVIYNGTNNYFNNGASNSYGKMTGGVWNRIDFLVDLSSCYDPSLLTEINISIKLKGDTYSTGLVGFTSFMVTEDGNLYDWSYDYTASTSYSQITQLSDMINLRVSKGDVLSQINLESGRVLIDSKQLLLNANTVKFSGSAFIPNSVIENLSADKITAGTLNAANVNVINLNAKSLTAGTISGTNLSMNLDTGAVQFQKGSLTGKNNLIRLDMDNSYLHSLNSTGSGFKISDGQVSFFDGFLGSDPKYLGSILVDAFSSNSSGIKVNGANGASIQGGGNTITVGYSLLGNNKIGISGNTGVTGTLGVLGNFSVTGSKNAIHVTRDGTRATPAYEMAESYLGDLGRNYTRDDCEVWVEIDELFSDTVNTDIAYEVFLQAYDDAIFWVSDFRSDKFLVKSDKPMARFAWEIKAKRRGYENDRLVIQESFDNKMLLDAHSNGAFKGDGEDE